MNGDIIQRFLEIDFQQAWFFLTDTLRSPATNVTAFALILAAITVVMIVVVLILVLVFMSGSEEDDEDDEASDEVAAQRVPVIVEVEQRPLTPEELQAARVKRLVGSLVWLLIFGAVWIVGGAVSREDTVCLSCHSNAIHTARIEDRATDPHGETDCVSCHETPNIAASVTLAVPGRAVHYVVGFVRAPLARGFGAPVANRSCSGCHEDILTGTFVNETRGIKVSHVEPLEARALCSDCHTPRPGTGVINRFTVGMDPCLRCHDQEVASAECSFCHTKDVGLAVQTSGEFKPQKHTTNLDCSGCHDQTSCDACHGIRMPHTVEFMGVGHARPAVEDIWFNDGKVCKRCHTDQRRPCSKCHNTMPSHPPGYMPKGHQAADPYNNGCDQCHGARAWIVGRNYCGVCHERYNKGREPPVSQ